MVVKQGELGLVSGHASLPNDPPPSLNELVQGMLRLQRELLRQQRSLVDSQQEVNLLLAQTQELSRQFELMTQEPSVDADEEATQFLDGSPI